MNRRRLLQQAGAALLLAAVTAGPVAAHEAAHEAAPDRDLHAECDHRGALPSPDCGVAPTPAIDGEGRLWLAFTRNGHIYVTHAPGAGEPFAPPVAVNRVPERIYSDGENRPKLALGPGGEVYVSWARATGPRAGDVRFARSLDGGQSFEPPQTVNDNRDIIAHSFDSMTVDREGRIYIAWLDRRDAMAALAEDRPYPGTALYYAVSTDQGASFAFNRKVADHACQCCRLALAVDRDDSVLVLWRHIFPENIRDHAIARLTVDGASRGEGNFPVRATYDDWHVEGCPHHGPDMALDAGGIAHMVWFTAGNRHRGVLYGRVDPEAGEPDGEYVLDASSTASRPQVLIDQERIYAVWKSFDGERTQLLLSTSDDLGRNWSSPAALAYAVDEADYPLLIRNGDRLYVSWHTVAEGYRLIPLPTATIGAHHHHGP